MNAATPVPVLLLSGPNLNLFGDREPEIYGAETLADHVASSRARAAELGIELRHVHSNSESELVDEVHRARAVVSAIIVNAGAFTHSSWALHDALASYDGIVVELHLSNPGRRESWRNTSVISPVATGVISGFGATGYELAVDAVAALIKR
jgi:3-dehydroquinate dehydratase-2